MSAYNFGTSGNNFTKLLHVTEGAGGRCDNVGMTFEGPPPTKFVRAKKRPKFGVIFDNFRL